MDAVFPLKLVHRQRIYFSEHKFDWQAKNSPRVEHFLTNLVREILPRNVCLLHCQKMMSFAKYFPSNISYYTVLFTVLLHDLYYKGTKIYIRPGQPKLSKFKGRLNHPDIFQTLVMRFGYFLGPNPPFCAKKGSKSIFFSNNVRKLPKKWRQI